MPQCWRSWSWMVLSRPTRPSRTNTPKDVLFIIEVWNAKVGNQETPGVTGKSGLGVRNEAGSANRVLPRGRAGRSKHPSTTRDDSTWTSPDAQYWNQTEYILCSQRWRSSIQSATTRLGADCGSDYELLTAKFRLKLKKAGKTTRPLRYDLNQIPYDYTVKVTKRFKALWQSAWRTMGKGLWHCTGGSDQNRPQEKEMQKGKMVVWGGHTNSWKKNRSERQRRKDIPIWMQSSKE